MITNKWPTFKWFDNITYNIQSYIPEYKRMTAI